MAVLLALAAALAYGVSDFVGGVASRRTSAWPVAVTGGVGGLLGACALALAFPGSPAASDLLWGAVAGVGGGMGTAFLYRGLGRGRMGVVAPVSAVGAALLPVVVGVVGGERPSAVVWAGVLVALPAIWLVSSEPAADASGGTPSGTATGLLDGVAAGAGFGFLFAATGQVDDGAGYWPLALGQVTALGVVVVLAVAGRVAWWPRLRGHWWGLPAGLLASLAVLGFLLATQQGLLTVAAVLASLYPAATVLLAVAVLREVVHRTQALGLALCGVTVVLVALG